MRLFNALSPGPSRDAPSIDELAKRHREDCAGLGNLFAVNFERHGRGNNHIRALGSDFVMQRFTRHDEIPDAPCCSPSTNTSLYQS